MTVPPKISSARAPSGTENASVNQMAITAAVFAALSVIFLPLAWFLGTAAILTGRVARARIAGSAERGESLASVSITVGWVTVAIVSVIYVAVLISAVV
jgi:hypothetical protein